jgi:hypothetical protein
VKIKCITLWQPWASLIAIEAKPLEFRGWSYTQRPTGVKPGDRIAIAAGARKVRETDIIDLLERIDDAEGSTGLVRDKALPALYRWMEHQAIVRDSIKPNLNLELLPSPQMTSQDPFPLSTIVCTATIGEPKPTAEAMPEWAKFINDSNRLEHAKWAWPMLDVRPTEPIPCKGAQGFFWVSVPEVEVDAR